MSPNVKKESIVPITIVLVLGAIVAVLIAGCSNDLPVASPLERTRVLGARVEIASDPGRAEVSPGEAASVVVDRRRTERAGDAGLGVRARARRRAATARTRRSRSPPAAARP